MMNRLLVFTLIFLGGCHTIQPTRRFQGSAYFGPLFKTGADIIQWENSLQSADVSYSYPVSIGESLYPNQRGYSLTNKKRYKRPAGGNGLEYTIEYYTSPDDSVRAVLHEWNMPAVGSGGANRGDPDYDKPVQEAFAKQFSKLSQKITHTIGNPSQINIAPGYATGTQRDDCRWSSPEKPKAYLLMFKRDEDLYRQIRLVVYLR